MKCDCETVTELRGSEVPKFIESHLQKVGGANWQVEYLCPITGISFIKDFPDGDSHGGGAPRLRRKDCISSE